MATKNSECFGVFYKNGHIAGPISHLDGHNPKVDSIMALDRPGGHTRVVGNLNTPIGQSLNEGISKERLACSHDQCDSICRMVVNARQGAFMAVMT